MRCTVPVPMPSDLATFKIPKPFASSLRTFRFGHASYLRAAELYPLCYSAFEPAFMRRRIIVRSNSAIGA
jgi:hypothetical protein